MERKYLRVSGFHSRVPTLTRQFCVLAQKASGCFAIPLFQRLHGGIMLEGASHQIRFVATRQMDAHPRFESQIPPGINQDSIL
jgi:hypothetical protein